MLINNSLKGGKVKNTLNKNIIGYFILMILIGMFYSNVSPAQNMPMPVEIQVALLSKVIKYNSKISNKENISLTIVYNKNSRYSKDVMSGLLTNGFNVKTVEYQNIEQEVSECDLVYFMPGIEDYRRICRSYQILSVTGSQAPIEKGDMSLAFGIKDNKPIIYVNVTSLKSEGQYLSSDILRIAKVYD